LINIFPNPTNDYLHLTFNQFHHDKSISLTIVDVSGQKRYSNFLSIQSEPSCVIDVKGFKAGVYFLKLSSEHFTQQLKFIKE